MISVSIFDLEDIIQITGERTKSAGFGIFIISFRVTQPIRDVLEHILKRGRNSLHCIIGIKVIGQVQRITVVVIRKPKRILIGNDSFQSSKMFCLVRLNLPCRQVAPQTPGYVFELVRGDDEQHHDSKNKKRRQLFLCFSGTVQNFRTCLIKFFLITVHILLVLSGQIVWESAIAAIFIFQTNRRTTVWTFHKIPPSVFVTTSVKTEWTYFLHSEYISAL